MAAAPKIGVVNFPRVLQKFKLIKTEQAALGKRFMPQGKQIIATRKTLLKDVKTLRNTSAIKISKRKELAKVALFDQQKLRNMQVNLQRELLAAQNKSLVKILSRVKKAIAVVAKREKFDLILTQSGVAYYPNQIDVTKLVIAQLSK